MAFDAFIDAGLNASKRDEEANTQWVKNKASPFNCLSTGL